MRLKIDHGAFPHGLPGGLKLTPAARPKYDQPMRARGADIFEKRPGAHKLVVLLHAYGVSCESLDSVGTVIKTLAAFEDADILRPRLPVGLFSTENPNSIALRVVHLIDEKYRAIPYREIYLVGHSVGALLTRKVYVIACGETSDAPFESELQDEPLRPWACNVKRIILLAGMNRGWRISYHLSLKTAIALTVGVWFGHVWEFARGRKLLIFQVRRGAPFLTQLRLQWLAMRKHLKSLGIAEQPLTVQLLGSIDDLVSPEDNIDLISGRDFIYLDVGWSGHANVIEMGGSEKSARERRTQLTKALTRTKEQLRGESVPVSDYRPRQIDREVKHVIFVIHGIRDAGYWTQKIGRRVLETFRKENLGEKCAMETASYGYFPMAPFLMSAKRREKVEWFLDQYAEAVSYYPNAKFYCIGHSNGTYLIARALEEYSACRFERIVFAGSVVRQGYNWQKLIDSIDHSPRVRGVANYVATADWVVAWFPKLFQYLHLQDIGSAGHDGFSEDPTQDIRDERFVAGGHGAALDERNWDGIAQFIVTGRLDDPPAEIKADRQVWWVKWPGYCPPLVWLILLCLVFGGGWIVCRFIKGSSAQTAGLIFYAWGIWRIVTRL